MLATDQSVSEAILDVRAALGTAPADLVLHGCRLVNVCSEEIHGATIAIRGSRIVAIREEYSGSARQQIDCSGLYALPGSIEPYFERGDTTAESLLARGVTSVVHGAATDVAGFAAAGLRCLDIGGAALPIQKHQICASADQALFELRQGTTVVLDCGDDLAAWRTLFDELRSRDIDSSRFLVRGSGRDLGGSLTDAALAAGFAPANALQMTTFNAAIHFALDHEIGSVTPGRRADIVLVREPGAAPEHLILNGQLGTSDTARQPKNQ